MAPGLRVAWLMVREHEVRERIIPAKQSSDLHSSTFAQSVFLEYVTQPGALDAHIARIRSTYFARQQTMVAALRRHMPGYVRFNIPVGGMFLWATIDRPVDTQDVFETAAKERVVFVPGRDFYPNRDRGDGMRLNFSNSSEAAIEIGIERLAKAIIETCGG